MNSPISRRHYVILPVQAALIGTFFTASLFAADSRFEISPNRSIILPETWRVLKQAEDITPPPREQSSMREVTTRLLLTAVPMDGARDTSLSVFRMDGMSSAPPITAGQMGEKAEQEKLLTAVLSQGFNPGDVSLRHSRQSSTITTTFEVSAKNARGESRIFTSTVTGDPFSTLRLCTSRPENDKEADREIELIIQSFQKEESTTSNPAQAKILSKNEVISRPEVHSGVSNDESFTHSGGDPSPNSPEVSKLVQEYQSALIMVEGQKGVGSGFLCSLDGQTFAFTNIHVIAGNPGFKITTLADSVITPSACGLALGRDLARFEIPAVEKSFEIMTDFEKNLRIGDTVIVPGNSEGARVVKVVIGKVVGIGPDRIEIDAPFVKGCSGSPIVHLASGKVIGIATYLIEKTTHNEGETQQPGDRRFDERFSQTITRRFGYRLDLVKEWEPVQWQRFFAQSAQVESIELVSDDFIKLLSNPKPENIIASAYSSREVKRPIEKFTAAMARGGRTMSPIDRKAIIRGLIADLRQASSYDINGFDSKNAYDYFRRKVEGNSQLRNQIYEGLTQDLQSQ